MAERFQAANGVGLVVGSNEMQFAVGAFYQTWLARNGEFFFIGRANNAYLLELETAHFAVMLSAEPIHTGLTIAAWRTAGDFAAIQ
ncbi:Uncharacterised protein [Escherichia coli]|nr:Uncharacterised protein [Escherichia coli]